MKKMMLIFSLAVGCNVAQSQALLILLFGDKLSTETFQMGINASASAMRAETLSDSMST